MNYIIKTEGLMCGHCDASVETALLNVAGVTDAEADHETQTVTVTCSDEVAPEQLPSPSKARARSSARCPSRRRRPT